MTMRQKLLHGIGVVVCATLIVVATTLAFIPESREPGLVFAYRVLMVAAIAHMLWSTWGIDVYRTPVHKLPSSRTRPRFMLLTFVALTLGTYVHYVV